MLYVLPCSWPFRFIQLTEIMSKSITTRSQYLFLHRIIPESFHDPGKMPNTPRMFEYPVILSSQLHELSDVLLYSGFEKLSQVFSGWLVLYPQETSNNRFVSIISALAKLTAIKYFEILKILTLVLSWTSSPLPSLLEQVIGWQQ